MMHRNEILDLVRQVDINVFCLWQGEKGNRLYGAIKDSAYELFIVACSIFMVRQMQILTVEEISQTLNPDERMIICGNSNLMEH